MRIGFAYNPTNEAALELRERAAGWCQMHGVEHWAAAAGDTDALRTDLPKTDVLFVLGGDGTFLRAARAVAEVDVPLLGVNLGKIGFLSKVEADELEAVLARIAEGRYRLEERMVLEGRIHPGGGDATDERMIALNDIVIARGALARVCRLDVSIDDLAPGHVHRRRARRREPDRVHRLLVLGRRPDRRAAEPQPDRDADRGLPVRHPVGRRRPDPDGPLPHRRRARSARLDRRTRGHPARGRRHGGGPGDGPADPARRAAGHVPFWDLLRHKVELLPS